ncbi:MAG TPA: glycine zipper 2TM domain-containing protein [Burkholderiales bacterium]|nr:glycine zipper 2TM domain-containing protein [Burkholderiales bacterium]
MQAALLTTKASHPRGVLYPLLVIAAISVIIFSALGAAAIAGWLPRAQSGGDRQLPQQQAPTNVPSNERGVDNRVSSNHFAAAPEGARTADRRAADPRPLAAACVDCGVVESIAPVEVKGQTNGLGMIAGGVTGALVGNQVGRGNGNALATIGGAAGGAFAGNEIEKHAKKTVEYKVRVRMPDGTFRTLYQPAAPAFAVGDKVKVANGRVVKPG